MGINYIFFFYQLLLFFFFETGFIGIETSLIYFMKSCAFSFYPAHSRSFLPAALGIH